jgi:ferredoxin
VASHSPGEHGVHLARLRIEAGKELGQHKVMFCTLCKKCLQVCPTEALRWHPQSGAVELLVDACTACDQCVQVCPTGVILHSPEGVRIASGATLEWAPVICDLCAGEPACARVCPTGAIFVAERKELA